VLLLHVSKRFGHILMIHSECEIRETEAGVAGIRVRGGDSL
jgi:hypothetical protein